jgi:hypothetical protein
VEARCAAGSRFGEGEVDADLSGRGFWGLETEEGAGQWGSRRLVVLSWPRRISSLESLFYCKGRTLVEGPAWGSGMHLGEILRKYIKRRKGPCPSTHLGEILREKAKDLATGLPLHTDNRSCDYISKLGRCQTA